MKYKKPRSGLLNIINADSAPQPEAPSASAPPPPAPQDLTSPLFDDTLATMLSSFDGQRHEEASFQTASLDMSGLLKPLPFGYQESDIKEMFFTPDKAGSPEELQDVFVVPVDKGHLVYAPLQRKAILVSDGGRPLPQLWNDETWEQVQSMAASPAVDMWKLESELNPAGSAPTEAVFIPTIGCNLRCVYCYSSASNDWQMLEIDQALAALDNCAEEVKKQNLPVLSLRFLGGGEPTAHPELLKRATAHVRELADRINVRGFVSLVTNGVMKEELAEWCANNIDRITVSIDGPPDIQDSNRQTAGGGSSYPLVVKSIKILSEGPTDLDVRATVTESDLPRMGEIVRHFSETFGLKSVCLEPMNRTGRATEYDLQNPLSKVFTDHFLAAREVGREIGVRVEYSSAVLSRLQVKFCTSVGRHFGLNPDGSIAGCPEIAGADDDAADLMVVGEMRDGKAHIDTEKVAKLRSRTLNNLPTCSKCFARYHCSGGCPIRAMRDGNGYFGPYSSMCYAIRSLIGDELNQLAEERLQEAG